METSKAGILQIWGWKQIYYVGTDVNIPSYMAFLPHM